jgi:hypothetical protein
MRYSLFILIAILMAFVVSCGGSNSVTSDPMSPDVNIDIPDITPDTGDARFVTVTNYYPSPTRDGTGEMGDGQIAEIQMLIDLNDFTSGNKDLSALTNEDREAIEATANGIAYLLYLQESTNVFGGWPHVFTWESGGTTAQRNVQSVIWMGLLQYVELYDLYDPSDSTKTPINADVLDDLAEFLSPTGFLGDAYATSMAASDTDASTSADRPYAWDVILLSRSANVFNNSNYQYMAETWFAEIADEFTGAEYATRMVDARNSLALWDSTAYIWAAALTGFNEFADYDSGTDVGLTALFDAVTDEDDGMIQELVARRSEWEGIPLGTWDYTDLGWCFLPAGLSEVQNYATLTTEADNLYAEALDEMKDNSFRHRSYGYFGYEEGGRLHYDSRYGAYGLTGLGFADQNDFSGSDPTLFGPMDGQLEWFNSRVGKDILFDTDIDLDGNGDAGAVRSQFRGNVTSTTGGWNWEVTSEVLAGMVISGEQFFRYPDVPLP